VAQDPAGVVVLGQGVEDAVAAAPARRHDRQLARERHELLEQGGHLAESSPGDGRVIRAAHRRLALAVVAEPPGLQQRRRCERRRRTLRVGRRRDRGERRRRDPEAGEQLLLEEPVRRHRQRARPRQHGHLALESLGGDRRHGLELARHHVGRGGERRERPVVVPRAEHVVGHRARTRVGGGVEHREPHPERHAGEGEHPGELPAAEDADPHASRRGSGSASTASVRRAR
jgi:hypothetical protein